MAENGKKRRASVPVSEKLQQINEQIERHQTAIADLQDKRQALVAAHAARAKAMLAEIGEQA